MVSDREIARAAFTAVLALAEKITGERLVVAVEDANGGRVEVKSYGDSIRWEPNASPLETVCPVCRGVAGETENGQWHRCAYCEGAGYLPTDAGQHILKLIRHNLPTMLKGEACERT